MDIFKSKTLLALIVVLCLGLYAVNENHKNYLKIENIDLRFGIFEKRINDMIDAAAIQSDFDYDIQENNDAEFKENAMKAFLLLDHEINDVKRKLNEISKKLSNKKL